MATVESKKPTYLSSDVTAGRFLGDLSFVVVAMAVIIGTTAGASWLGVIPAVWAGSGFLMFVTGMLTEMGRDSLKTWKNDRWYRGVRRRLGDAALGTPNQGQPVAFGELSQQAQEMILGVGRTVMIAAAVVFFGGAMIAAVCSVAWLLGDFFAYLVAGVLIGMFLTSRRN